MRIRETLHREGFTAPVALLAITVVGALVTGGFYASSQQTRISTGSDIGSRAFHVAEHGLDETIGAWKEDACGAVPTRVTYDPTVVENGGEVLGTYTIAVRRIGVELYLVTSEGRVGNGPDQAVRRVATVLRTDASCDGAPASDAVIGRFNH